MPLTHFRHARSLSFAKLFVTLLVLSSVSLPLAAQAEGDIIQIPLSQQGDTSVARPSKGMTQADVETKFGAPESKQGPVGNPPISRWQYPAFVVTFEYDHVVHTVLKHKPVVIPTEAETEPAPENNSEPTPPTP